MQISTPPTHPNAYLGHLPLSARDGKTKTKTKYRQLQRDLPRPFASLCKTKTKTKTNIDNNNVTYVVHLPLCAIQRLNEDKTNTKIKQSQKQNIDHYLGHLPLCAGQLLHFFCWSSSHCTPTPWSDQHPLTVLNKKSPSQLHNQKEQISGFVISARWIALWLFFPIWARFQHSLISKNSQGQFNRINSSSV